MFFHSLCAAQGFFVLHGARDACGLELSLADSLTPTAAIIIMLRARNTLMCVRARAVCVSVRESERVLYPSYEIN